MKSLGFGLLGLLCCTALAWADGPTTENPLATQQNDTKILPIINLFTYVDDKTPVKYGLSLYKMNWFEAEQYCASQQFTLASIPSTTEQDAIIDFIKAKVLDPFQLMTLGTEPIWISGTNQGAGSYYMWQGIGARVVYKNFMGNPRTNGNFCMTLNGMTGIWSTDNCRTEHFFLCQNKCPQSTT